MIIAHFISSKWQRSDHSADEIRRTAADRVRQNEAFARVKGHAEEFAEKVQEMTQKREVAKVNVKKRREVHSMQLIWKQTPHCSCHDIWRWRRHLHTSSMTAPPRGKSKKIACQKRPPKRKPRQGQVRLCRVPERVTCEENSNSAEERIHKIESDKEEEPRLEESACFFPGCHPVVTTIVAPLFSPPLSSPADCL